MSDEFLAGLPTDSPAPLYLTNNGRLIIDGEVSAADYELVAQAFREHPELCLVIGHRAGIQLDSHFRAALAGVRHLDCFMHTVESWDFLDCLPESLQSLTLGQTVTRPGSIAGIARFSGLKKLALEGQTRGLESLRALKSLEELELRSVTLPDLSFLLGLERLWSLDIKLGGTRNLGLLGELKSLRYLELWMIRGLEDISAIGGMTQLKCLHLESLARIAGLPDMSRMLSLRAMLIQNLKSLRGLSPLRTAPALEELQLYDSGHLKVEEFRCIAGHPTLKRVRLGLGSERKSKAVQQLLGLPETASADLENLARP